jgi:formiminoglutamate deiminase
MSGERTAAVYHCEYAWLGGDVAARDVRIEVADGAITAVTADAAPDPAAQRLAGLTMPGLANTHSHVFHRAIRGHSQSGVADFWRWRDLMYRVASRLDPDRLYRLALATYAEMALSGVTSVGEFFYLHHRPDGSRYDDPNEMGRTVIRAANDAGIRITLLDTCYLQAGLDGGPLTGAQLRFGDGSARAWMERVDALADPEVFRPGRPEAMSRPGRPEAMWQVGAAIHSVRAVPRDAMAPIAEYARHRGMPLHVHVSEQPAENQACLAAHGLTPVGLLAAEGVLGARTTAVHATHLTDDDITKLGTTGTAISMCCTTERDLGDGVGPAARLAAAGSPLCVGSDAHMMIDLWEEGRAIELDERLVSGTRGHLTAGAIAAAISVDGSAAIGWPTAGLAAGAPADLVTVSLDSVRTAGARSGDALAHALFSATAADVSTVIVAGRPVVQDGQHLLVADPGLALQDAIAEALGEV